MDELGYNTEKNVPVEPPKLHSAPEGVTLTGITLPENAEDGTMVTIPIEGAQDGYGVYSAQDNKWYYSSISETPSTDSNTPTAEPDTIWDYLGLPGIWEGVQQMTIWDWGEVILEVAAGFTPFGIYYDLRDIYEAVESGDGEALVLALIGLLPVGDVLKVLKKIQKKGKAALKKAGDVVQKELDLITEGIRRTHGGGGGGSIEFSTSGGGKIHVSPNDLEAESIMKFDPDELEAFEEAANKKIKKTKPKKKNNNLEGNFKKIDEKDGNRYAEMAGYLDAHAFKKANKVGGKDAHWNMTIDTKTRQLGLLHRKTNTHILTGKFIKK